MQHGYTLHAVLLSYRFRALWVTTNYSYSLSVPRIWESSSCLQYAYSGRSVSVMIILMHDLSQVKLDPRVFSIEVGFIGAAS